MSSRFGTIAPAANPNWPEICVQWLELTGHVPTRGRDFAYEKVQLSGHGFTDAYDPHHFVETSYTSLLFPSAQRVDGTHIARSVTQVHNPQESEEYSPSELRARLLGLYIGKAALRRYNAHSPAKMLPTYDESARKVNVSLKTFAERIYGSPGSNAPLAAISVGRVLRHKLAAPGSEIAVLYVPTAVPAPDGLAWLQESLRTA